MFKREPFLVVGVGIDPDNCGVGRWVDPESGQIFAEYVRIYFDLETGYDDAVRRNEATVLLVDGQGMGHIVPSDHYLADVTVETLLQVPDTYKVGYLGKATPDVGDYFRVNGVAYQCSFDNKAPIRSHLVVAH
jgi:hypothetical protein